MEEVLVGLKRAKIVCDNLETYNQRIDSVQEKMEKMKKNVVLKYGGICFLITVIITSLIWGIIMSSLINGVDEEFIGEVMGTSMSIWFIVILLGCIGYSILRKKKRNKLKTEIRKIQEDKNAYISENVNVLSVVPDDYWFSMALEYILKMIETNRASTLNQALDMCDNQIHRWKMENISMASYNEQIAQREYLRQISRNTAISAAADIARLF